MTEALGQQIGGDHYTQFEIQPIEFIHANRAFIGFLEGCIIKRICRYRMLSGGGLEDLEKIKHEVDLLIQLEYGSPLPTPRRPQ